MGIEPEVIAVNRTDRLMSLDTGETVVMRDLFIPGGNATDDSLAATSCTGQMADGRWLAVDLTAFDGTKH